MNVSSRIRIITVMFALGLVGLYVTNTAGVTKDTAQPAVQEASAVCAVDVVFDHFRDISLIASFRRGPLLMASGAEKRDFERKGGRFADNLLHRFRSVRGELVLQYVVGAVAVCAVGSVLIPFFMELAVYPGEIVGYLAFVANGTIDLLLNRGAGPVGRDCNAGVALGTRDDFAPVNRCGVLFFLYEKRSVAGTRFQFLRQSKKGIAVYKFDGIVYYVDYWF